MQKIRVISKLTLILLLSTCSNVLWSMDGFMDGIETDDSTVSESPMNKGLNHTIKLNTLPLIEDGGSEQPTAPTRLSPVKRVFQCLMADFQKQIPDYIYARLDQKMFKSNSINTEAREELKTMAVIVTDPSAEYGHRPFEECYEPIVALNDNEFITFRSEMQSILDHEVVTVLTDELKEVYELVQAGGYTEQYRKSDESTTIMFMHEKPLHQEESGIRHQRLTAVKQVLLDLARKSEPLVILDQDFSKLEELAENSNRFYLMQSNSWITTVQLLLYVIADKAAEFEIGPLSDSQIYERKVAKLKKQYAQIINRQEFLMSKYSNKSPEQWEKVMSEWNKLHEMRKSMTIPSYEYTANNPSIFQIMDSNSRIIERNFDSIFKIVYAKTPSFGITDSAPYDVKMSQFSIQFSKIIDRQEFLMSKYSDTPALKWSERDKDEVIELFKVIKTRYDYLKNNPRFSSGTWGNAMRLAMKSARNHNELINSHLK